MFERFTDRARRVVVQAQEEARTRGHDFIGPEHLLLGLTHERVGGVGAKTLESLGIGLDTVRQRVEAATGRGDHESTAHIPFTPAAKQTLELSLAESVGLGHRYVGTEHLLLGLLRTGDNVAVRVLTELGADLDGARAEIVRILDEYRRDQGKQAK
jgi:ATP-dependent Clp protease ATP-binding subunit ClpC